MKYCTPKINAKAEIYQDGAYINNAQQSFYLFLIHNKLLFRFLNVQKFGTCTDAETFGRIENETFLRQLQKYFIIFNQCVYHTRNFVAQIYKQVLATHCVVLLEMQTSPNKLSSYDLAKIW